MATTGFMEVKLKGEYFTVGYEIETFEPFEGPVEVCAVATSVVWQYHEVLPLIQVVDADFIMTLEQLVDEALAEENRQLTIDDAASAHDSGFGL